MDENYQRYVKGLQEIYKISPVFPLIIDFLAKREPFSRLEIKQYIQTMAKEEGKLVGRHTVIHLFKLLKGRGGRFRVGRRGGETRFEFEVNSRELARAVQTVAPKTEGSAPSPEAPASHSQPPIMVSHTLLLRPGLKITLELPDDLTHKDAQRIYDFVKMLPFEEAERP